MCNNIFTISDAGIVSVCGVRVGMTRKEAKDTLFANGFEVKENQRCLYIENVTFDDDLPSLNNICYGIDDTYRVSHIRVVSNLSNKVIATRFYERFLSMLNQSNLLSDYKDKWLVKDDTLATQFTNSINKVSIVCHFVTRKWTGEIDRESSYTSFTVSSKIDLETDVKRVKNQYYNLLDTVSSKGDGKELSGKVEENNSTSTLERIGIALYIVILISYPFCKVFLPPTDTYSSIAAFGSGVLMFFLYLIGWWFLVTPICWILSTFFWKGNDKLVTDVKKGCAYPLLALMIFLGGCFIYGQCKSSSKYKRQGLYSTEKTDGGVYICTSLNAKKYHSTPDCRWLENCSGEIKEVSLAAAEAQGKSPCKGCY